MGKLAVARRAFVALVASILCLPTTGRVHAVTPGEVDLTFDAGNIEAFSGNGSGLFKVLVQPDGKILIGGDMVRVQGVTRYGVARLHPDGTLDTSFVPPFAIVNTVPFVRNMALQPDGKILVAGQGMNVNGIPYSIARLNPDGSLDPTFTLLEMAVSRGIQGLWLLPDGRILIGGDFSNIGPAFMKSIARLNADGTLDVTFNLEPTTDAYGGNVETIVVQPDGNYLIGGDFLLVVGPQTIRRLARIRPDATVDTSFQVEFNDPAFVRSIALRPDGAMFVSGGFGTINGTTRLGAALITSTGLLDTSFDAHLTSGAGPDCMLRQPDGKLLVTGNFIIPGDRQGIARLDETGAFDSFYPPGGLIGLPHTLAVQPDGKVFVAGWFTEVGGVSRNRIARLLDVVGNSSPNAVDDAAATLEDTAVTVNVVANDTDPDGDPLTVASVTSPAHGTAAISGTGSVLYTPDANYNGADAFSYTIDDGHGGTDAATVTVAIAPVNDAPVAQPQSVVTSEDVVLGIVLAGTDVDGDPLTYSVVNPPGQGSLSGAPPNLMYAPASNFNGSDGFTFRVHDGTVFSPPAAVAITVTPVNDAPAALADAYATPFDVPLVVAAPGVLGNDTDVEGGPLIALLATPPAVGTLALSANGAFTYTPPAGFSGPVSFTYRASDGSAQSSPALVSIAVGAGFVKIVSSGDPVPGGTGTFTTFPGTPSITGSLVVFRGLGVGGQQGVFRCQPGDPCVPIANLGTLIPGGNGTFTGFATPASAGRFTSFIGTGAGQAGSYSCDRFMPGDPCVPIATLGSPIPGGTGTFTGFASLDAAGGLTAFVGTGAGQVGAYACDRFLPGDPCRPVANQSTPIPNGTGTFSGFGDLAMAVDMSLPTPPPIVGFIGSGTGQQGVYSCDTAIPTDPCHPIADRQTSIPGGTGTFTGFDRVAVGLEVAQPTPVFAFIGRGGGQHGVYACTPGDPCTPVATLATAIPGGVGTFTGFAEVSTSRGHTAFLAQGGSGQAGLYVASTLQEVVAVGDTLDGRTVASLRFGRDGLDGNRLAFGVTFTDGSEAVFLAQLSLVGNAAPNAIPDAATTSEDESVVIDLLANDNDPDGDPLAVTALGAAAHGTVVNLSGGHVRYTPNANVNGTDAFTYAIGDGQGGSDTTTVTITIAPVNDAPVAAGDSYATTQDITLSVPAPGVLANDTDVDGPGLTAVLAAGAVHGTVTLQPNGSFQYVPAPGFSGSDSFTYRASDGAALSNVATVGITVTGVPSQGWHPTGSLQLPRAGHTATRLLDGRVLVVGGLGVQAARTAELYDPATGQWTRTADPNRARVNHTATLLANGKVLVAGSSVFSSGNAVAASAELFDPASGTWTMTGNPKSPLAGHTATLLPNGKVLVAGGAYSPWLESAIALVKASPTQLYDPATGTWALTGNLPQGRIGHQATLLANGRVLVAGGTTVSLLPILQHRSDVYDPATGVWKRSGDMGVARAAHTATLLADGRVLAAGGTGASGSLGSAERFDPATGTWTAAAAMPPRALHAAARLGSGKVLLAAGLGSFGPVRTAVLFDPAPGTWSDAGNLANARILHTLTVLADGGVLVVGGTDGVAFLGSAERYSP
jgi:uncharacterized delta-60 repeat protein